MMNNDRMKQKEWLSLLKKALKEMNANQAILLKRGDLFSSNAKEKYKRAYEELTHMQEHIKNGGDLQQAYRYLQLQLFMKDETFFMDLFQTQCFPHLFELFEYE